MTLRIEILALSQKDDRAARDLTELLNWVLEKNPGLDDLLLGLARNKATVRELLGYREED